MTNETAIIALECRSSERLLGYSRSATAFQ